jgi:hypothetical protein
MQNSELYTQIRYSLENSLDWLHKNLRYFDILDENYKYGYTKTKALNELVFLSAIYRRKNREDNYYIREFVNHTLSNLERSFYIDRIKRNPNLFLLYVSIYESLKEFGYSMDELRTSLQSLIDQKYVLSSEKIPFRELDLIRTLNKCNFKHSLNMKNSYKKTLLYNNPEIFSLQRMDAYNITHTIFYITDFGFSNSVRISKTKRIELTKILNSLLYIYTIDQDWDLLAELLVCCDCIKWYPPIYLISWNLLIKAQKSDGSIPRYSKSMTIETDKDSSEIKYFEDNYHPTIITALACILFRYKNNLANLHDTNYTPINGLFKKQISSAILNTYSWIEKLAHSKQYDADFFFQCMLLLAQWMYHNNILNRKTDLLITSQKIHYLSTKGLDLLSYDSGLILLIIGILNKISNKYRILNDFVDKTLDTILSHRCDSLISELQLFLPKFLSLKIKNKDNINKIPNDSEILSLIWDIYNDKISPLLLYSFISSYTNFGNDRLKSKSPVMFDINTIITAAAYHSLFIYNLDVSAKLLRSMLYLHLHNKKSFYELLSYLLLQQQKDGKFGYFGPEVIKLKEENGSDEVLKIFLPVTISILWLLQEIVNPTFRLLNSINIDKRSSKS